MYNNIIPLDEGLKNCNVQIYFGEVFKNIHDYIPEIKDYYMISNYGRIYHKYLGRLLSIRINKAGYCLVDLASTSNQKTYRVHRLIYAVFYPEKFNVYDKSLDIHHKNGDILNNYIGAIHSDIGNLDCINHDNHIMMHNKEKIGSNNNMAAISEDEAKEIIYYLSNTMYPDKKIVEIVGGNSTIKIVNDIRMHKSWNHLSNGIIFNHTSSAIINEDIVKNIINLLLTGNYTSKEISNIIGNNVSIKMVDDIRNHKTWSYLTEGLNFPIKNRKVFSDKDLNNFCKSFVNHKDEKMSIANRVRTALIENNFEITNSNFNAVYNLYSRKYYNNIGNNYNW